jgi:hypothetical protein
MDCERFDEITLDLLYDELDELTTASARRHLAHCRRCQDLLGRLRATKDLSELPLEEPPDELFEQILAAERVAHRELPLRARASRAVSVLAGYAMRPQLAMAAVLLLMIGTSLVFVRVGPGRHDKVAVTELGTPAPDAPSGESPANGPRVVTGDAYEAEGAEARAAAPAGAAAPGESEVGAASYADAMAAYQAGRYAEAERLFGEVAARGGERAAAAALHEGHAARNGSGCQRAAALYDGVTALYAGTTVADEAAWHAASCYQSLGQVDRARAHLAALAERPAFEARAAAVLAELEQRGASGDAVAAGASVPATSAAVAATAPSAKSGEASSTAAASAGPSTAKAAGPEAPAARPVSEALSAPAARPKP